MKTTITFTFLLFISGHLFAQHIYLFHDKSCMDRYQYRFSERDVNAEYIAYIVHQQSGDLVHLEIGVENDVPAYTLPGKLSSCSGVDWDEKTIKDINTGKIKLSIVRKENKAYFTTPVSVVTLIQTVDGKFAMTGSGYAFTSTLNEPVGRSNLRKEASASDIYFKGKRTFAECTAFQFVRLSRNDTKNFAECTIIPGIGIVEERSGADEAEADLNNLRLFAINAVPIENYLKTKGCNPVVIVPSGTQVLTNQPAAEEKIVKPEGDWTHQSDIESGAAVEKPSATKPVVNCPEVSSAGIHIVQSGENLYAIARKYGLSVAQLRTWNKLTGDVIKPCQRLLLSAAAPAKTVATATAAKTSEVKKTAAAKASQPATNNKEIPQLWKNNKGFHTVQAGETLTLLSKMYGYSMARLMDMNGMTTTDLKVGQILKVNDCVCDVDKFTTGSGQSKTPAVADTGIPAPLPANYNQTGSLKQPVSTADVPAETPETEIVNNGTSMTVYSSDVLYEKGTVVYYHTVAEGETLFSIARMYQTTVDILRKRNDLNEHEVLIVGQRIAVK